MKIYIATYSSPNDYPYQKVFKTKNEASEWLKKQHARDFQDREESFKAWSEYGAWTAKIKQHTITI